MKKLIRFDDNPYVLIAPDDDKVLTLLKKYSDICNDLNKRNNEPLFRLKNNLRSNIWSSIKKCGYKNISEAVGKSS